MLHRQMRQRLTCRRPAVTGGRKKRETGRQSSTFGQRLPPMQVIDGALRVGCGLKMARLSFLSTFKPRRDVGGVVVADFRRQFQVGAEESGAELGHEFLAGIALVAPGLAAEIPVEAAGCLVQCVALMRERGVVALGVAEGLDRRHLDVVGLAGVEGAVATDADVGAGVGEECLGVVDCARPA